MRATISPDEITGLVLAGGQGRRMGGVDKGLQNHHGMPLALHALLRLSPQVGQVLINANRNLAAYESMGVPVWPDAMSDYPGPLAGILVGMEHCETPYLATVPVFCLIQTDLLESLVSYLHRGERKIDRWTAQHRCASIVFDDASAFVNANTLSELQALQG